MEQSVSRVLQKKESQAQQQNGNSQTIKEDINSYEINNQTQNQQSSDRKSQVKLDSKPEQNQDQPSSKISQKQDPSNYQSEQIAYSEILNKPANKGLEKENKQNNTLEEEDKQDNNQTNERKCQKQQSEEKESEQQKPKQNYDDQQLKKIANDDDRLIQNQQRQQKNQKQQFQETQSVQKTEKPINEALQQQKDEDINEEKRQQTDKPINEALQQQKGEDINEEKRQQTDKPINEASQQQKSEDINEEKTSQNKVQFQRDKNQNKENQQLPSQPKLELLFKQSNDNKTRLYETIQTDQKKENQSIEKVDKEIKDKKQQKQKSEDKEQQELIPTKNVLTHKESEPIQQQKKNKQEENVNQNKALQPQKKSVSQKPKTKSKKKKQKKQKIVKKKEEEEEKLSKLTNNQPQTQEYRQIDINNKQINMNNLNTSEQPKDRYPDEQAQRNQGNSKKSDPNRSTTLMPSQVVSSQEIEPSNQMIIKSAQKQRLSTVFNLLKEYLLTHQKYKQGHQVTLVNLQNEINRKKTDKLLISYHIREFLANMTLMTKQFHQACYKYEYTEVKEDTNSNNPNINARKHWNKGFQELIYLRKAIGNDFGKQSQLVKTQVLEAVKKLFQGYLQKIDAELKKKSKQFTKQITKINKVYYKEMDDKKQSDDLFVEIVIFVNIQKEMRQLLKIWGEALALARNQYIVHEEHLFLELQKILNAYRNSNKMLFEGGKGSNYFKKIIKLSDQIKSCMLFNKLCPITDIDYIRCVQSLDEKQKREMKDQDFLEFIQLKYFNRLVGDASKLLKGITGKQFQLKNKEQRIINTIAGNLVRINKNTCQMKDKFPIKHISVKLVQQSVIEIKQITPGLFFDSERTVRLIFKDNDRAQELIIFLNNME